LLINMSVTANLSWIGSLQGFTQLHNHGVVNFKVRS
jgi:hypothetical protein